MKTYHSKFSLNTWVLITLASVCIYEALSLILRLHLLSLTILAMVCIWGALSYYPGPVSVGPKHTIIGLYLWSLQLFLSASVKTCHNVYILAWSVAVGIYPVWLGLYLWNLTTHSLAYTYKALPLLAWPKSMTHHHFVFCLHLWRLVTVVFISICGILPLCSPVSVKPCMYHSLHPWPAYIKPKHYMYDLGFTNLSLSCIYEVSTVCVYLCSITTLS